MEQRIAESENKKAASNNGGLGKAFGYIFKNRQMKWVVLALLPFRFTIPAFTTYNESIMTIDGMSTDAVSTALIYSPIVVGLVRLAAGFASDKLGQKNASTIFGIATVVALIGFILYVNNGTSAAVVGILIGISTGSYWTVGDQIGLMMSESDPTNTRGSVSAAAGLLQTVVAIVAIFVPVLRGLRCDCVGYRHCMSDLQGQRNQWYRFERKYDSIIS